MEHTESMPLAAPSTPNHSRWAMASFAAQVALLGLGIAAGVGFGRQLESHHRGLQEQRADSSQTRERVESLAAQTQGLKAEMMNLRQTVASNTGEDVLFLKTLLLKPNIDLELARTVATLVHRHAQQYGKDPNLVLAIMAEESDFNPRALSPVGAVGLMQVMPHWKKVLAISGELTDPETNIRTGLQILGFYLEMYQDLDMALTAYNRGPGPVDAALMKGQSPRNGYAPKVLATFERLKKLNVQASR